MYIYAIVNNCLFNIRNDDRNTNKNNSHSDILGKFQVVASVGCGVFNAHTPLKRLKMDIYEV